MGARRAGALLPPAHAPLPDPAHRGTNRPGSGKSPRPDRAVACAARQGAGRVNVAVLGAGGTIAPAIVRDLAESEEVSRLRLLDLDGERAAASAHAHGLGKATA